MHTVGTVGILSNTKNRRSSMMKCCLYPSTWRASKRAGVETSLNCLPLLSFYVIVTMPIVMMFNVVFQLNFYVHLTQLDVHNPFDHLKKSSCAYIITPTTDTLQDMLGDDILFVVSSPHSRFLLS